MLPRWLSLFVALAAPATVAARSAPGAHGFVVDHWTTEDGLPLDHATDVAFTPDGFVWIATFEGLVRFDGARFQSMGDALASTLGTRRIAQVATHPRDGALWILAEERAVARYAGDEWRVWSADALGGSPSRWTTDSEAIWLWGTGGVLRIDETPTKLPWADNHGRSAGVAPAADGSLLFGAQEGAVFWVPPDGSPERLGAKHGLEGWPRYLDRAADGSPLLIGAEGVLRWDGSRFTPAPDDASASPSSISLGPLLRSNPRQEPSAVILLARICAGGGPSREAKGRPYRKRYNTQHLHSAIRFVTPDARHFGLDTAQFAKRRAVYVTGPPSSSSISTLSAIPRSQNT